MEGKEKEIGEGDDEEQKSACVRTCLFIYLSACHPVPPHTSEDAG